MGAHIINKIKQMNINKKITYYLFAIVLMIGIIILVTVSISSGRSIKTKSKDLVMQQLESISGILDITLNDFNEMSNHIMADSSVQSFISGERNIKETKLNDDVYQLLRTFANSNSYLDYLCVLEYNTQKLVYQGLTWKIPNFQEKVLDDYAHSLKLGYGNKSISITRNLFLPEEYSLNIYQPISKINDFTSPSGLLVISVDYERLVSMYMPGNKEMPVDIFLASSDGKIMSTADLELLGTTYPYMDRIKNDRGSFKQADNMVVYDSIDTWNWYVIGKIPNSFLLKDHRKTVMILALLILVICIICMVLCFRIGNSLYRPLRELVSRMSQVSSGNLDTKMREDYYGQDVVMLSDGFNDMVKKINILMQQVKEEQHQVEQIQFNALQSQIKPHFLYNALECIHWQAEVDQNAAVSKMVKALATYYRLCLSKGQDVIPLSQEIAHVQSYLIIQNMRYDDIIESDFTIDPYFNEVKIPKMTLQPLVENAIYHGVKIKEGQKGKITIRTYEHYNEIIIIVSDNGCGMTQEEIDELNTSISRFDESYGYGIRNVHRRIEIIFGKGFGLFYRKNEFGGITVEIKLPNNTNSSHKS